MKDRLRDWARVVKRDVHALYLASRDPRVPWYAKALAVAVAGYALSPIDLIPDFVPVLGYLDDVILVPLGILLVIRLIPPEIMAEHRELAAAAQERPVSRTAALVIVSDLGSLDFAVRMARLSLFCPLKFKLRYYPRLEGVAGPATGECETSRAVQGAPCVSPSPRAKPSEWARSEAGAGPSPARKTPRGATARGLDFGFQSLGSANPFLARPQIRYEIIPAFGPRIVRLRQRPVYMQGFREELGHNGQLGTVDRIAELLYCWCAPQMEDAMCYERDYKIFEDRKKAEATRVVQERRAGLIDRLLNAANKHGEKTRAEETPVKEVAPAK